MASGGKKILITNDDGIRAEGLIALADSLEPVGSVIIVAPETEQSASSHAITLDKPLRIAEYGPNRYAVSGTPTDSVLIAVKEILERKPDILVSGINHGPNMGEDVTYSGTVAAAIEGNILGIPSIAVSITSWTPSSFDAAAEISRFLVESLLDRKPKYPCLWNVNVPSIPKNEIRGIRITKLGSRIYKESIIRKKDPRGKDYFWIGGGDPGWNREENSDFSAVSAGYVSVTPLHLDITDYKGIFELKEWSLDWKPKQTTRSPAGE